MGILLKTFFRLPYPARCIAATAQGYKLRHQRYGPETEALVREAHERESWSPAQWKAWTEERLAYVLHRAATRVPYYREHWAERRRRGDRASCEHLENWPILEKEEVRRAPERFLADDIPAGQRFSEATSGTTGTPLVLWRNIETTRALYALSLARTRLWHGLSLRDRWGMIGGKHVAPLRSRRPPFWVWNAAQRQLYMSCYHLAPDLVRHYLDALARYRVVYLYGATSSLLALANEVLALGRRDLRMHVAIANAEPVFEHQRRAIEEAFQCPVRETYGMAELVAAASECPHGRLHVWPEVAHFELLRDGEPVPPGQTGEVVGTCLINPAMPLIRFRVGDLARMDPDPTPCPCGRRLPILAGIEGRTADVLITRDGRLMWFIGPVFYGLPLREAQVVQDSMERVTVRYAPAPGFTTTHAAAITGRLRERMGEIAVALEEVPAVPRTSAGKLRAVICNVSAEEREAVLASVRAHP